MKEKQSARQAADMTIFHKLHGKVDLNSLLDKLIIESEMKTAIKLVKGQQKMELLLISKFSSKYKFKDAHEAIKSFGMNIDNFPEVKNGCMKNSLRWLLKRYIGNKETSEDFLPLHRIEDLLYGDT